MTGGDDHRVEIVVAEFSSVEGLVVGVEAKYGSVGVPLADGADVSKDGLFGVSPDFGAEALGNAGLGPRVRA